MLQKVDKESGEIIPVIHTWRNPPKIKALKADERYVQHFGFEFDVENRCLKVVKTEKEDREAYIQSFVNDCGVYNVLKKYSKTGDISFLQQGSAIYADLSKLPEDNLDPEGAKAAAKVALASLNEKLGLDLTLEELQGMSDAQIAEVVRQAAEAQAKPADPVKKEGE